MLDMRDAVLQADALAQSRRADERELLPDLGNVRGPRHGSERLRYRGHRVSTKSPQISRCPRGMRDAAGPPTLTVSVPVPTATEAGTVSGTFRITRSPVQTSRLRSGSMLGGTASPGIDYATTPATATIPADAAFVDVPITPVDDAAVESNETVTLTLRAASSYTLDRHTPEP